MRNLKKTLQKIYENANKSRDYNMNVAKIYYDRNIKPVEYEIGLKHGLAHKFHGPFTVLAKHHNNVDYLIRKADAPKARKFLIHHNRLKRYFGTVEGTYGADVNSQQLNRSEHASQKRTYTKNPNCKR